MNIIKQGMRQLNINVCRHTDYIRHAENFQLFNNKFVEKVPPGSKKWKNSKGTVTGRVLVRGEN